MPKFLGPTLTQVGNAVWHAGNDGSGSNLDADLLDGINGATFARQDQANTFTQLQTLNGGITVTGTVTLPTSSVAVTALNGNVTIAKGGTNSNATPTAGAIAYGTGTAYAFTAAGTAKQALVSNAASAPTWATLDLTYLPDAWPKKAVKVATTTNNTLFSTQTVDGIGVVAGDRVLVKNQTTPSQNGIYEVVSGGPWLRAPDADTTAEISGATIFVEQGSTHAGQHWQTTFRIVDTLNTTTMSWYQVLNTNNMTSPTALPAVVLGTVANGGTTNYVLRSDATIVAFDTTAPTSITFGTAATSAATGSIAFAARRDHTHAFPAMWDTTLPAALTSWGGTGTAGVATVSARRDHVHAMPATPVTSITAGTGINVSAATGSITINNTAPLSFATPSIILGTVAAAGSAGTAIRSDATIVAFDGTAPANLATSAATGSAPIAARRDHVHSTSGLGVLGTTNTWTAANTWGVGNQHFSYDMPTSGTAGIAGVRIGPRTTITSSSGFAYSTIADNIYYNGTNWIAINTGYGALVRFEGQSGWEWLTAGSTTAGAAASLTSRMTLTATGTLYVNTLVPSTALAVNYGGTGSTTRNFVDLTSSETIGGAKTFSTMTTHSSGLSTQYSLVSGQAGVASGNRLIGGNASGAPTSGNWGVGDWVVNRDGTMYMCTSAGIPGTWIQMGAGGAVSSVSGTGNISVSPTTGATVVSISNSPTFTGTVTANYFQGSAANGSYFGWPGSPTSMAIAQSSASIALVVKGQASQTADLQQWHTSTGAIVASIGPKTADVARNDEMYWMTVGV